MLEDVKALLGFTDTTNDELLNTIIKLISARLCTLIGAKEVPAELAYIVTEATVTRFNKIGSEGMQSHTVEGEAFTFNTTGDLSAFTDEIEAWRTANARQDRKIVFL